MFSLFVERAVRRIAEVHDLAQQDDADANWADVLERLAHLRQAVESWPESDRDTPVRTGLLRLVDDTMALIEARRDGGDVAGAEADIAEQCTILSVALQRRGPDNPGLVARLAELEQARASLVTAVEGEGLPSDRDGLADNAEIPIIAQLLAELRPILAQLDELIGAVRRAVATGDAALTAQAEQQVDAFLARVHDLGPRIDRVRDQLNGEGTNDA